MKKFVLVLIVCTLLCTSLCLLLAGCDSSDAEAKDDAFNSNGTKIELIYNSGTRCVCRVWYPVQWFADEYSYPSIRYKLSKDDELTNVGYYAEYINFDSNPNKEALAPDSWLYVAIDNIPWSAKRIYIDVSCYVLIAGERQTKIMAQSTFSLT